MKFIKNLIGSLIRDIVVCYSKDFVEWYYKDGFCIYKTILPFSFSIGKYKFLKSNDYIKKNN